MENVSQLIKNIEQTIEGLNKAKQYLLDITKQLTKEERKETKNEDIDSKKRTHIIATGNRSHHISVSRFFELCEQQDFVPKMKLISLMSSKSLYGYECPLFVTLSENNFDFVIRDGKKVLMVDSDQMIHFFDIIAGVVGIEMI